MAAKRILIIENNIMNMRLVEDLLTVSGYEVLKTENAEEGIDLARAESPDLILMDILLPGMDGLTATGILKKDPTTKHIPVVALTAYVMKGDEEKILSAGYDGYIAKPIDFQKFRMTVGRFVSTGGWRETTVHRGRILVVSDDDDLNLITPKLREMGHECDIARDMTEVMAKFGEKTDMVILGVMMMRMEGFEVARWIRSDPSYGHVPIVMITHPANVKNRLYADEMGVTDIIYKPVDAVELQMRVNSLLRCKADQDYLKRRITEIDRIIYEKTLTIREEMERIRSLQKTTQEAHLDSVMRLSLMAEYKDRAMEADIHRVGRIAAFIGKNMGLPARKRDNLSHACPMHDVGNIGVPDRILLKNEKLDQDEWDLVRHHTTIGRKILSGTASDILQTGATVAMTHHEKWDGTGYPGGLTGEDIPLCGRICAVADVFDTLTTNRPYREALETEQALKIMNEGRGTHFDPKILDAFLEQVENSRVI